MIQVGDMVKVISATQDPTFPERKREYIPIGTICTVVDMEDFRTLSGGVYKAYGISNKENDGAPFWYLENELEKGHLEWVKEEK